MEHLVYNVGKAEHDGGDVFKVGDFRPYVVAGFADHHFPIRSCYSLQSCGCHRGSDIHHLAEELSTQGIRLGPLKRE